MICRMVWVRNARCWSTLCMSYLWFLGFGLFFFVISRLVLLVAFFFLSFYLLRVTGRSLSADTYASSVSFGLVLLGHMHTIFCRYSDAGLRLNNTLTYLSFDPCFFMLIGRSARAQHPATKKNQSHALTSLQRLRPPYTLDLWSGRDRWMWVSLIRG